MALILSEKMSDLKQKVSLTKIHIGREIKRVLQEQRRPASWLAQQLSCNRTNVYKIFGKSSIDTHLLMRISKILSYDFFYYLSIKLNGDE